MCTQQHCIRVSMISTRGGGARETVPRARACACGLQERVTVRLRGSATGMGGVSVRCVRAEQAPLPARQSPAIIYTSVIARR